MIFHSRRSVMVIALTMFAFASLILAGYAWVAAVLILLLILFSVPQRYEVLETEIVVRSGVLRRRYPYRKILGIVVEGTPEEGDGMGDGILLRLENDRQVRLMPRDAAAFRAALEEKILAARAVPTQVG